jgi:hypothetical protein
MMKWKYGVGLVKENLHLDLFWAWLQASSCDGLFSDISVPSFFLYEVHCSSQAHNPNLDGAQRDRTKIQRGQRVFRTRLPVCRPGLPQPWAGPTAAVGGW